MYKISVPDFIHWQKQVKCQAACPIHTDAGRYVQLIAEEKYRMHFLLPGPPTRLLPYAHGYAPHPVKIFAAGQASINRFPSAR
jgi:hypothetical protein